MGDMHNHFYIEKNYSDFFKKSEILNSSRTEGIVKRENFILLMALGFSMGFKTKFENLSTLSLIAFHISFLKSSYRLYPERIRLRNCFKQCFNF